jgi:hypothetical protein
VDAASKALVLGDQADAALSQITAGSAGDWESWIEQIFQGAQQAQASRVLAYAKLGDRAFADAQNLGFATGALEVEASTVAGARLGPDQWKTLPLAIANREAVLFDSQSSRFLYVAAGEGTMRTVATVSTDASGAARDLVDSIDQVALADLQAALDSGRYRLVSGSLA